MKSGNKLKSFIFILIIIVITICIMIFFLRNKFSIYIENNNYELSKASSVDRDNNNYKLEKISKHNDIYQYTNNWKFDELGFSGSLTIKYNPEKHIIERENQLNNKQYKELKKSSNQINGDLILNDNKDSILIYANGFIPYINSKTNVFGIIDSRVGYNLELENGKKIVDVMPTSIQPSIQIFLYSDTSYEEKQQLEENLNKLSNIKKICFISKEEALNTMKKRFKDDSYLLDGYDGENNIFPESYEIILENNEDIDNVENEIRKMKLEYINNIVTRKFNKESMFYQEVFGFDFIIKDNNTDTLSFATSDVIQTFSSGKVEINDSEDTYLDIFVIRNKQRELQGYIVEKENNKKVFLDKYRDVIINDYEFMNAVNIDSKIYIVCSNSNIKTEEDLNNAKFEVFDIEGNSIKKNKKDYIKLLKLKQLNYSDKHSLEYILFE